MASPCFSFLIKILLCVSLFCLLGIVHRADVITFPVSTLFPSPYCKASTSNANSTLKLVHKYGPCSPLFKGESVNHTQLLLEDIARVEWIQSKFADANAIDGSKDSAISLQVSLLGSMYLTTIGLGTPKMEQTLGIDTGSSLTWTKCKPCAGSCSEQTEPLFDPFRSSSYANISFSDPACLLLLSGTGYEPRPSGSTCNYTAKYMDESYSEGFFATETVTLSPTDTITPFKFGCSQKDDGFNGYAGMLGLTRNDISFLEQSATKYGKYFSYCFPHSLSSTGFLTLGKGSGTSAPVSFTPIDPTVPLLYVITINGINVRRKEETVFSNTIIDSGTLITRLPTQAYDALRSAFRQEMLEYKLSDPHQILDTCYDFRGSTHVTIPKIKVSFSGSVEVNLDHRGVLFWVGDYKACLAFAPTTGVSIYGSAQQRTFEVVYDVDGGRIGFRANGCS